MKKLFTLSFLWMAPVVLWHSVPLAAQGTSFGPQQIIDQPEIWAPRKAFVADLDGDGHVDVIAVSTDNKVAWYRNDGDGHFGPQQVIAFTPAANNFALFAADLNGDGHVDLLTTWGFNQVVWYANDGSGNFAAPQLITDQEAGTRALYVADVNGDGYPDVLTGSLGIPGNIIAWYANDGSGNFGPQQVISETIQGINAVYAADLDGDGDLDVLSAFWSENAFAWHENDGQGNFGPPQFFAGEISGGRTISAADFNGDGHLDVLVSASIGLDDVFAWYANDGQGNFGLPQTINAQVFGISAAFVADLNHDGLLDAVGVLSGRIIWHPNDGNGNFGPAQPVVTGLDRPIAAFAEDLNGDGFSDLLCASSGDHRVSWYANDGNAVFASEQPISYAPGEARALIAADLDGDGAPDMVAAFFQAPNLLGKVVWYRNDGSGSFGAPQIITEQALVTAFLPGRNFLHAADFDADGDLDLLVAALADGEIVWYENDGDGNFGPPQIIYAGFDTPSAVAVADLDGDGDLDVLAATTNGTIAWHENDGSGNFGPPRIFSTGTFRTAGAIVVADFNGDGTPDVMAGSSPDFIDGIAWFANDGSGNFGSPQSFDSTFPSVLSLDAADLDGDGDIDLAMVVGLARQAYWYRNDGQGNFTFVQSIPPQFYQPTWTVFAADLDKDGALDLLTVSAANDNAVFWHQNNGSGYFISRQAITTQTRAPMIVLAADLDGDGDLDVLSFSRADQKVAWYENLLETVNVTEPLSPAAKMTLFPNPSGAMAYLSWQDMGSGQQPLVLRIFNAQGQLVVPAQTVRAADCPFALPSLPAGVYLVNLAAGGEMQAVWWIVGE